MKNRIIRFFNLDRLQYTLLFICIIATAENTGLIHLPILRYFFTCLFLLNILILSIRQKKRNINFKILIYLIILMSIITFVRGFESDDLSLKKYFSSTFSFYFFSFLMVIEIDKSIFKFLKSTIKFSFVINIVILLTLPFWLSSSFFIDQLSRILLSISTISFFLLTPYLKKYKNIVFFNFIIGLVLNIIMARRAESLFFGGIFIVAFLYNYKISPIKKTFYIFVTSITFLFLTTYFDFGSSLFNRFDEGYENRDFLFEEVLLSLNESNSELFGKGAQGTYFSVLRNEDRYIVENGFYDLVLKSGWVFLGLFVFLAFVSIYRGFFKSKNIFAIRLGIFVFLYLLLMFGHGVFEFSYRVFFLWLAISICLSDNLIKLDDNEIKKYLY